MKTIAAITKEKNAPYEMQEIELKEPKADEILVQMKAVGVCHTDEAGRLGFLPFRYPVVLGHEGAGIVKKVGSGVTDFKVGDAVCLTYASCGCCEPCRSGKPYACERMNDINFMGVYSDGKTRINWNGKEISSFFSQSSFAGYALVNERSAVKIPEGIPFEIAAPLGCGIQTGAGIVLNSLKPSFGDSIVIGGCGTVGLSAIMAAKLCGCSKIIAVGGNPKSLELAKKLGATDVVNRKEVDDIGVALGGLTEFGIDFAIDTSGNETMINALLNSLTFTGSMAIAGGGFSLTLGSFSLCARTIKGVSEGDSNPSVFIPRLLDAYKRGNFPIDELITCYPFEQINQASMDSNKGKCIKAVLTM